MRLAALDLLCLFALFIYLIIFLLGIYQLYKSSIFVFVIEREQFWFSQDWTHKSNVDIHSQSHTDDFTANTYK